MKGDPMFVWLLLVAVIYYAALVLWYKFRSQWLGKEKEEICPKVKNNVDIIGKSCYQKRKETQEIARPHIEKADIEEPTESESTFAPETETTEKTEFQISPAIPVERLDEIFGQTYSPDSEQRETEADKPVSEIEVSELPESFEPEDGESGETAIEEDIDWDAEEAELQQYSIPAGDEMYASGITFEELGRLGTLLQKEDINKQEVAEVGEALQKIAGTDILDAFVSALPDALEKISSRIEEQLREIQSTKEKIPAWMSFDIKNYT